MARKKKQLPLLEHVEITDVAAEGKALVRVDVQDRTNVGGCTETCVA